jgi:hypothetical protein
MSSPSPFCRTALIIYPFSEIQLTKHRQKLKVAELKELLAAHHLVQTGKKDELVKRLVENNISADGEASGAAQEEELVCIVQASHLLSRLAVGGCTADPGSSARLSTRLNPLQTLKPHQQKA